MIRGGQDEKQDCLGSDSDSSLPCPMTLGRLLYLSVPSPKKGLKLYFLPHRVDRECCELACLKPFQCLVCNKSFEGLSFYY